MAGVGAPRPTATRAPRRGRGCLLPFPGSGRRRRATASREGDAHDRDVPHRHSHSVVHAHTVTDGHWSRRRSDELDRSVADESAHDRAGGARVSRVMHPRAHVRCYSLALNVTQKYLVTHSQLYIFISWAA